MPLASTMAYVKNLINGQNTIGSAGGISPGQGRIKAYVSPPDPNLQASVPTAYVWTARGNERRNSGPRSVPPLGKTPTTGPAAPAGWKMQTHNLMIWLVWFDDSEDSNQDSNFPWFIDTVMNILRTAQMPMTVTDAGNGLQSQLINLGQNMDYDFAPLRATASQRYVRYDASITAPVEEWIQA